jgi:glutamate--cysteine ligase catalytic subunit
MPPVPPPAQSVDDRTPAERGVAPQEVLVGHHQMAGHGVRRLAKSRYDSISSFICNHLAGSNSETRTEKFNDIDAPMDEDAYKTLVESGVDEVSKSRGVRNGGVESAASASPGE